MKEFFREKNVLIFLNAQKWAGAKFAGGSRPFCLLFNTYVRLGTT